MLRRHYNQFFQNDYMLLYQRLLKTLEMNTILTVDAFCIMPFGSEAVLFGNVPLKKSLC